MSPRGAVRTPASLVLGLDAGATHVRAAVADAAGRVLGRGEAGPANPYALGALAADRARRQAITAALRQAHAAPRAVGAVVVGSAGVSEGGAGRDVARRTRAGFPGARVAVVTDGEIAQVGALAGGAGIVVIAGTGSIVWGRNRRGEWARAGGWGWLLGDEGSGQWLGRQGYAAALRALDGSGRRTAILPALQRSLRLQSSAALATQPRPAMPAEFGALAPLVLAAAAGGDAVAREFVRRGGAELARQTAAVAHRLRLRRPHVCYGGSVLTSGPVLRRALQRALQTALPGARLCPPAGDALDGALQLARQLASGPQPRGARARA